MHTRVRVGGMGATARYQHSRGRVRTGIAAANVEVEGTDVAATSRPQSLPRACIWVRCSKPI